MIFWTGLQDVQCVGEQIYYAPVAKDNGCETTRKTINRTLKPGL